MKYKQITTTGQLIALTYGSATKNIKNIKIYICTEEREE